ncbi:MAG TPA: carbohydrate binding domain-containing protein, partial [Candidatus Limnocylindria bacterium]|nr:carbohydrate binding domain-containing protein [Candidatus Limnocylindria bacterium]
MQRPRAVLSLVAAGSAAALLAGVLTINGAATADQRRLSDNLVTNPDFESGTEGWNAPALRTALVSAAGHDSRRAAQVTALNDGATLLLNDRPNVVQVATPGATYVASAWVRSDVPRMTVSLRFREVDGGALVGRAQTSVVLAGSGWQQISGEYVVAGANHQLAIQVLSTGARKGATLSVDDVDVREVLDGGGGAATPPSETPKASPTESATPKPDPTPSESTTPSPKPTETATPKPTPSDPPASGPTSTLFGETMWMNPGESWA